MFDKISSCYDQTNETYIIPLCVHTVNHYTSHDRSYGVGRLISKHVGSEVNCELIIEVYVNLRILLNCLALFSYKIRIIFCILKTFVRFK